MKNTFTLIVLIILSIFITGCMSNEEYFKKVAGQYEMTELETKDGVIYTKEELKESGFSGTLVLNNNGTGIFTQDEKSQQIKYDKKYIYYISQNTKDSYNYEDENIVLISDVGGKLRFIRK